MHRLRRTQQGPAQCPRGHNQTAAAETFEAGHVQNMVRLLTAVVTPQALIALHDEANHAASSRKRRVGADDVRSRIDNLLDAMITATITNGEYAREVVSVWAAAQPDEPSTNFAFGDLLTEANRNFAARAIRHQTDTTAHIGAVLLDRAARALTALPVTVLPRSTDEVEARLARLVVSAAADCSYNKKGDRFLWNLLQYALPSHILAATFDQIPYAAISTTYGEAANAVVRTWTATKPQDMPAKIDYASGAPKDLIAAAGIINEHVDKALMWVHANADMLRATEPVMAAFYACGLLSDTTGVFDGTTFYAANADTPVSSVLLKWGALAGQTALVRALTMPTTLGCPLSMMAAVI